MWWQAHINQEIRDDIPSQRAISDMQKKRSRPVCIITGHKHCGGTLGIYIVVVAACAKLSR